MVLGVLEAVPIINLYSITIESMTRKFQIINLTNTLRRGTTRNPKALTEKNGMTSLGATVTQEVTIIATKTPRAEAETECLKF